MVQTGFDGSPSTVTVVNIFDGSVGANPPPCGPNSLPIRRRCVDPGPSPPSLSSPDLAPRSESGTALRHGASGRPSSPANNPHWHIAKLTKWPVPGTISQTTVNQLIQPELRVIYLLVIVSQTLVKPLSRVANPPDPRHPCMDKLMCIDVSWPVENMGLCVSRVLPGFLSPFCAGRGPVLLAWIGPWGRGLSGSIL